MIIVFEYEPERQFESQKSSKAGWSNLLLVAMNDTKSSPLKTVVFTHSTTNLSRSRRIDETFHLHESWRSTRSCLSASCVPVQQHYDHRAVQRHNGANEERDGRAADLTVSRQKEDV